MTCKGNVFQKKKANLNFKSNNYYKIILLSSKYAASGLDLIEASKIIFIDPIYGDFDTTKQVEDQAIGRAHRLGQQKPVEVVRFLIKDTIEEECYTKWKQQRFKYEA
jgi:SNF2 family DNA or RNA helicase